MGVNEVAWTILHRTDRLSIGSNKISRASHAMKVCVDQMRQRLVWLGQCHGSQLHNLHSSGILKTLKGYLSNTYISLLLQKSSRTAQAVFTKLRITCFRGATKKPPPYGEEGNEPWRVYHLSSNYFMPLASIWRDVWCLQGDTQWHPFANVSRL